MNKQQPLGEVFATYRMRRETVAFVEGLKLEAQQTKRTVGQAKNPFKAIPGLEADFEKAGKTIRYCDNILKEFEKNRKRGLWAKRAANFCKDATTLLLALTICVGLAGTVGFGLGVICIVLGVPLWGVALALLLGSLVAVGWSRK